MYRQRKHFGFIIIYTKSEYKRGGIHMSSKNYDIIQVNREIQEEELVKVISNFLTTRYSGHWIPVSNNGNAYTISVRKPNKKGTNSTLIVTVELIFREGSCAVRVLPNKDTIGGWVVITIVGFFFALIGCLFGLIGGLEYYFHHYKGTKKELIELIKTYVG